MFFKAKNLYNNSIDTLGMNVTINETFTYEEKNFIGPYFSPPLEDLVFVYGKLYNRSLEAYTLALPPMVDPEGYEMKLANFTNAEDYIDFVIWDNTTNIIILDWTKADFTKIFDDGMEFNFTLQNIWNGTRTELLKITFVEPDDF